MRRIFVLLGVFFNTVSANKDEEYFIKCENLINPENLSCCLSKEHWYKTQNNNFIECYQLPHSLASCNRDICIAKKLGFSSSRGKIDKRGLRNYMEESFSNDTKFTETLMERCVDGDFHKYGPPDICDLKKIKLCVYLQSTTLCHEWNSNGTCAGDKELIDECM